MASKKARLNKKKMSNYLKKTVKENKGNNGRNRKTGSKMMHYSKLPTIITLNIDGLNSPVK